MHASSTLRLSVVAGLTSTLGASPQSRNEELRDVVYSTCKDEPCREHAREITGTMVCGDKAAEWIAFKKIDPITDDYTCTVTARQTSRQRESYFLFMFVGGQMTMTVGGKDYPGRKKAIRVDSNPAFTFEGQLRGANAQKALDQLRTGTVVKTRMILWPSGAPSDEAVPVCDLPKVIDSCLEGR